MNDKQITDFLSILENIASSLHILVEDSKKNKETRATLIENFDAMENELLELKKTYFRFFKEKE
ncbi:hypothetical protein HB837_15365 [Listeria innocua]|uniref:hypothetical protein n=1 Tax=Listeria innocua TaxID=1642 RepID=UPI0016292368|nr:hypothetical protein [Listeria innocua]MBC1353789.1 hypothetical protein [Listeria innocua]